ncbi:MAG: hypothetical protein ACO1TE_24360 [Prosthecobacter sp.]
MTTSWFELYWHGNAAEKQRLLLWEVLWRLLLAEESDQDQRHRISADALTIATRRRAGGEDEPSQKPPQPALRPRDRYFDLAASAQIIDFPAAKAATPARPLLQVGQVWELPPLPALGSLDAVTVLIIEAPSPSAMDDRWTVIPFGPLPIPGTDGEWATDWKDDDPSLAVLSFWNHFQVPAEALGAGSVCFELASGERERMEMLWVMYRARGVLPPDTRRGSGPPLLETDDPRRAYEARCEDALLFWQNITLLPSALLKPRGGHAMRTLGVYDFGSPPSAAVNMLRIAHRTERLVTGLLDDGSIEFSAQDADGRPLESWNESLMVTATGSAARFTGASAKLPLSCLRCGFAVFDPEGAMVPFLNGK